MMVIGLCYPGGLHCRSWFSKVLKHKLQVHDYFDWSHIADSPISAPQIWLQVRRELDVTMNILIANCPTRPKADSAHFKSTTVSESFHEALVARCHYTSVWRKRLFQNCIGDVPEGLPKLICNVQLWFCLINWIRAIFLPQSDLRKSASDIIP